MKFLITCLIIKLFGQINLFKKSKSSFSCDFLYSKYDIRHLSVKEAVSCLLNHSVLGQYNLCRETFWKFLYPFFENSCQPTEFSVFATVKV